MTFLEDTVLSTLVADTDVTDTAYFSHTTAVANNGGGAAKLTLQLFFQKG